jgi:hypothetical protein
MDRRPSTRYSRLAAIALVVLVAGACGGTKQDLGTIAPDAPTMAASAATAEPTDAAATDEPAATPEPAPTDGGVTPEPATPAPTAAPATAAEPAITQRFFKVWTDIIKYAHYQAIIEISNPSAGVVDIGGGQDYTIYAKDGTVLVTGTFTYAFPRYIGPGQKGYLIESGMFDSGVKAKSVGKFEESTTWSTGTDPTPLFKVAKAKVGKESYGTGLQASAIVTNTTGEDATMAVAGFVFFDAKGKIIGGLYDNTVGGVKAGKSKGVKTSYPGTPPLKPGAVKKTVTIVSDYQFF